MLKHPLTGSGRPRATFGGTGLVWTAVLIADRAINVFPDTNFLLLFFTSFLGLSLLSFFGSLLFFGESNRSFLEEGIPPGTAGRGGAGAPEAEGPAAPELPPVVSGALSASSDDVWMRFGPDLEPR